MKVRERLRKFVSRFTYWLKAHRRGIFLSLWFVFVFAVGALYDPVSRYLSLPLLNPFGLLDEGALVALANPISKNQPHPISGVFYSEEAAEDWSERRPLAVMIDNHALARPSQFGLQKADVIYEAVAEGGITRFLAVFHSQRVGKLGPVRSSRVYYIDWALEFPAYYAHIGGASTPGPANINAYIAAHNVLNLNQFRLGTSTFTFGGNVLFRGGSILSRIYYTSTGKLWQAGESLYPGTNKLPEFAQWSFKADRPYAKRPKTQDFSFNFWYLSDYAVKWHYDRETNAYFRRQGGKSHLDKATKEQLSAKNVALVYTVERSAGDGTSHRLFTTTGQGNAVVYRDGQKVLATWKRPSLSSRMRFFERGTNKEIKFNRGLTWVEILSK